MSHDRSFKIWLFAIIVAIIFLMIQALMSVAHAATVCKPVNTMFEELKGQGFKPIWSGSDAKGFITALYSHENKSWRAVVVTADASTACIVAAGEKGGLIGISL